MDQDSGSTMRLMNYEWIEDIELRWEVVRRLINLYSNQKSQFIPFTSIYYNYEIILPVLRTDESRRCIGDRMIGQMRCDMLDDRMIIMKQFI